MSLHDHQTYQAEIEAAGRSTSAWPGRLLDCVLPKLKRGQLAIELPGGSSHTILGDEAGPHAHLKINQWYGLLRIALGGELGFSDAYVAGEISSSDISAVMGLFVAQDSTARSFDRLTPSPYLGSIRHALNRNTRFGSRRNISAHYDLGNAFYSHWLDAGMTYSSALFSAPDQTLEDAQKAKLERVVELLDIGTGNRILEIGIGWGSLAEEILKFRSCRYTGITLSRNQLAFARERLSPHLATGECQLHLEDYRDVIGQFDRIASIEMLEAVGEAYWPVYFKKLRHCLKPGGCVVLQVITIDERRFNSYRCHPDFIQQRVFPGGMLPTASLIVQHADRAGLRLHSKECFGQSYARTLAIWKQRFESAWPSIQRLGFDENFRRMWSYYMDYCRVGFEGAVVDVGFYTFTATGAPLKTDA